MLEHCPAPLPEQVPATHWPPEQTVPAAQHAELAPHSRSAGHAAAHVPAAHTPLQQPLSIVHAAPTAWLSGQQASPASQTWPLGQHVVLFTQTRFAGQTSPPPPPLPPQMPPLQGSPRQQSAAEPQGWPAGWQQVFSAARPFRPDRCPPGYQHLKQVHSGSPSQTAPTGSAQNAPLGAPGVE